jgi:hypothetical protein
MTFPTPLLFASCKLHCMQTDEKSDPITTAALNLEPETLVNMTNAVTQSSYIHEAVMYVHDVAAYFVRSI